MSSEMKDVLQQADELIKRHQYTEAWRLLLPFKSNPQARKRLIWLKDKQGIKSRSRKVTTSRSSSRLIGLIGIITLIVVAGLAIYIVLLNRDDQSADVAGANTNGSVQAAATTLPDTTESNPAVIIPTEGTVPTSPASEISPTSEDSNVSEEIDLEQTLRDWLMERPDVQEVLTLDIDMPSESAPIVYIELEIRPDAFDDTLADLTLAKQSELLESTVYGDFVVILHDGSNSYEYNLDVNTNQWK